MIFFFPDKTETIEAAKNEIQGIANDRKRKGNCIKETGRNLHKKALKELASRIERSPTANNKTVSLCFLISIFLFAIKITVNKITKTVEKPTKLRPEK